MKKYLILIGLIWLASCKVSQFVVGDYTKKGKDFRYQIIFKPDSSFLLKQNHFEAAAMCRGKWKFIAKDTILLMCDSARLTEQLSSGYISKRNNKVIILNNGGIIYNKVVLSK